MFKALSHLTSWGRRKQKPLSSYYCDIHHNSTTALVFPYSGEAGRMCTECLRLKQQRFAHSNYWQDT